MDKNRNKLILLVIIALIILIGLFVLLKPKADDTSNETETNTDFSKITECNRYDGEECELVFENVKLGNETITLSYKIFKNENNEEVLKFFFDDFTPHEIKTTGSVYLQEIAVIDDVFAIVEGEDMLNLVVVDENGSVALEYNFFIDEDPIREVTINGDLITIKGPKLDSENNYDYYNMCESDFYDASGYSKTDLGEVEYKVEYLGNNKFSGEELISSKTIEELRSSICN